MKRNRFRRTAKLTAASMLALLAFSACKEIDYGVPPITEPADAETETTPMIQTTPAVTTSPDRYEEKEFQINAENYSSTLQLEEVCENANQTYLMGYNGNGYIQIDRHEYATFTVHVPSTQYYKLTVRLCAFDTGVNVIVGGALYDNGEFETYDGISKGVIYAKDITGFSPFTINGVYLKKGNNTITLQSEFGIAYMDEVTVENGRTVNDNFYSMSNAPISSGASSKTVKIMDYFSKIYGEQTLTGQKVTYGTNAEIAAVYKETGRLPAIRVGDLTCVQSTSPYYDEEKTDLDLAVEWSENGGLVGYNWTWYSPSETSHYVASMSNFKFDNANTDTDLSEASLETIEKLYGEGEISRECYRLLTDLDEMAGNFAYLQEKGVTVLFSPLSDGGKGGYWWSDSAESYLWLWRTMVKRFSDYYKLGNIIWVWNGGSTEFYPGDNYVDIIGENIYNTTGDSGNGRFMGTANYRSSRAAAMTDCLMIPNADTLAQDNAHWLWFALGKGDVLIDENGNLTEQYSSNVLLEQAYNHESFITLDELPEFE